MDITISHNDEQLIPHVLDYCARESRAVAVETDVNEWTGLLVKYDGERINLLVKMGSGNEEELIISVGRIRHLTVLGR